MLEDWFRVMEIPMPLEIWHRLPRNAGYKYEYIEGKAVIVPEPEYCDVVLDMDAFRLPAADQTENWQVRPLIEEDWDVLPGLMSAAFRRVAPFATLSNEEMIGAMADAVKTTRTGGDGELVPGACMTLLGKWGDEEKPKSVGAALITLRAGEIARGVQVPLLTWVFVAPVVKRQGGGSTLLSAVVKELTRTGHRHLESVVCTGNHASMTWHWHRGFRMGPTMREKARQR